MKRFQGVGRAGWATIVLFLVFGLLGATSTPCCAAPRSKASHVSKPVPVKVYKRKDIAKIQPHDRRRPGAPTAASTRPTAGRSHGTHSPAPPARVHQASSSKAPKPLTYTSHVVTGGPGVRDSHGRIKRNEAAKREFMRKTGYPHGRPGYVVDHIVPLKRGGSDSSSNMQWQTVEEAKRKDKRE